MRIAVSLFLFLGLAPAWASPTRAAEGTPDPAFKRDVEKLAAQNDKDGMGKLVKSRTEDAVAWIVFTCEALADRSTPENEAFAAILQEAWKAGIGSAFAERECEALKNLGANRRDRMDLASRLEAARNEFEGNMERKDSMSFLNVIDELDVVAPGLEQVGDWYRASDGWIMQGHACDAPLREASADLHKAWQAYGRAIEARDKLELKDKVYTEITKRRAELTAQGHDKKGTEPAGGEAGGGADPGAGGGGAASEAGPAIAVATTFEAVPAIDAYLRPNFSADDVHLLWGVLPIRAKGSSSTFTRFEGSPAVHRVGPSDLRIDTDGDGQGDQKLALTGNPLLVQMKVGKGDQARPWAFVAQIGSRTDQYQRIEVNVEPNDADYTVYTLAAASVIGDVAGTPIRVIDEDLDGVYGSKPQSWGEQGLSAEIFQPQMDSIVIGSSKRARPWSELQQIGGKWYKLTPDKVGQSIQAVPVSIETGILKLDFKGAAPTWVIVRGGTPELENSYFDLVEGGTKGVEVPVGKYTLFYGELRKGKKKLVQKCLILPGKTTPALQVAKGLTAPLTLGAPFRFDFKFKNEGGKAVVEGRTVVVVGGQNERYERPWSCVPRPEVSWRKKGSKSPSKTERMQTLQDTEKLQELGWGAAWAPLDLELDLKGEKGPVEVQLVEKKHDLFGKVESEWKE